jgi:hypothetical protein
MQDALGTWTSERLGSLNDAELEILWFATFGGPPAAILERPEMERIFLESYRDRDVRAARLGRAAPRRNVTEPE